MSFKKAVNDLKKTVVDQNHRIISFGNELRQFHYEMQYSRSEMLNTLSNLQLLEYRISRSSYLSVHVSNTLKLIEQEINEKLNASNADVNDETAKIIIIGDNACSMYDPWTKTLMLNPMCNIECGHHYDRDSVMAAINNNLSVRCPVVGCASNSYIRPDHLQAAVPLQKKIEEFKAEQNAKESSSTEQVDYL